jgi:DNA modification methylase
MDDVMGAIYTADSLKKIRQVPDQSVDVILTDPPYNLGQYSTGNLKMSWRSDFNNDIASWDQVTFRPSEWVAELKRVLKPTGNLFAFTSYNLLGEWHAAFDPVFDTFQFMVWHKTNPPPKLRRAGFLNSCELIVCAWNKGHTWNFGNQREMHNFIETPIFMGRERVKNPRHPTQKPVRVFEHLLKLGSKPGDLVFDPFMGVGSSGVAAFNLGRRFLGFDREAPYIKAAADRFREVCNMNVMPVKRGAAQPFLYTPSALQGRGRQEFILAPAGILSRQAAA